jgi:hypothetical protein
MLLFSIWTLVHFFILLSFHFFNIGIYLLAVITIQEKHLQELGAFIPNKISFCVFSQYRSKTFLMDGKHECAYSQCRSSKIYRWSVCDLDFKSMINLS